jgi:hypothetical protein
VYSRNLDGSNLTFAASGWTWHSLFVLQDLETGSLWFTGVGLAGNDNMVCVSGPLQDAQLPRVDSRRTTWERWLRSHPFSSLIKVKSPF